MDKCRFLLIITALFITTHVAHASGSTMPWCDCHVLVKSTGGGKVYVTPNSGSQTTANCTRTEYLGAIYGKTHDTKNAPAKIYLAAKPDNGWEFDYWECTKKYGDYDNASGATAVNTKLYDALPPYQKAALSIMYPKINDGGDNTSVTASNDTNAIWIAHFKRAEMQTVKVESEQTSLGTANIDKVTNYVGDTVTISAWCGNSSNNPRSETIMFLGWFRLNETTGEKEFVTKDEIYTFKITEANTGTYYARYASGYNFWRVRNVKYDNYLTSVAHYTGPVTTTAVQSALKTQLSFDDDLATAITDAGTMMKLWISGYAPNTHREILDIYVQDEHTNQYYGEEAIAQGIFVQMSHQLDNTYYIQGNNGSFSLVEDENKKVDILASAPKSANWYFEGMDKDLTTKENYFAVAPSEFIGPDSEGNYWTTLRVCFNMLYETNEITPYIVTAADATTGTMELTEVTGGIIPEKTCVLLKCNSTDVTRNVMIPTTSTSSFNTSGNLLTSSTYYYKNQSVSSSLNLKGIKLVDGRIGFGGSTLTKVDGNRAYLPITSDVSVSGGSIPTNLANLCENGIENKPYTIDEPLLIAYAKGSTLWLKDAKHSICSTSPFEGDDTHEPDQNYEIGAQTGSSTMPGNTQLNQALYDQSNWLEVQLTAPLGQDPRIFIGHYVKAKSITGMFINKLNPTMTGVTLTEDDDLFLDTEAPEFIPNYYCPANFYGSQNGTVANVTHHYFFMNPKPQEYARIVWAKWDSSKEKMVLHGDKHGFKGEFSIDMSLDNLNFAPVEAPDGNTNKAYNFHAIIRKVAGGNSGKGTTLRADVDHSGEYLVYPLDISEQIPTEVVNVIISKQVAGVKYYNLAGIESDQPHQGVNIVVTTYTDGSRSSAKVLR